MGIILAIVLMRLFLFAAADPPSQQDYGLCSQVYIMHQYCTSQLSPTSTALGQRPVSQPRTGKAGPRGPRGIVNYTAINEKIAEKFSDIQDRIEAKFARWRMQADSEMRRIEAEITNKTNELRSTATRLLYVSCEDAGRSNGVVNILRDGKIYEVFCDMSTDGGNWIVFQRRMDGSVDFYRTWEEYATGFGNKNGEFWLGLETIHQLTQDGEYELRVDLTDWEGSTAYAKYRTFSISEKSDSYRLTVGGYSGTAGDSMATHNGRQFSAKDKDLDTWYSNCATRSHGAWWYSDCSNTNLNGKYNDTADAWRGIWWRHWKGARYLLKATEMKFRKK